jgi:hypothetical protein
MSRSRLIFIIFCLTAVLIATVQLRTVSSRTFNRFRVAFVKQNRLKQQLWQKQLQFESLVNPDAVSQRADRNNNNID